MLTKRSHLYRRDGFFIFLLSYYCFIFTKRFQNLDCLGITTVDIIQWQHDVAVDRNQYSYKQLFLHFYSSLVGFSASIVKSSEAAEEIYSDIFLKLWDMGGKLETIDNLKLYLYKSIKNASLNYLARYNKVNAIDINGIQVEQYVNHHTPETILLEGECSKNIFNAIQALPGKCQLVYRLIKEDGLSYLETAELLGLSVNTVETHMKTALKRLNASLALYLRTGNH
jgi:RNA polymerase sigma-70 factor (family 1)